MDDVKSLVRWGVQHAPPAVMFALGRRSSDRFAQLASNPALRADPYAFYAEMRAAGPLVAGRYALVTARYDVISELVRDPAMYAGFPEEALARPLRAAMGWARDPAVLGPVERPSMLVSNGPDHARLRRLASKAFTPRAVAALSERVEVLAAGLLDEMAAAHRDGSVADIAEEYARTLPMLVIAEILGVPTSMREHFVRWTHAIAPQTDLGIGYPTFRRSETGVRELYAWLDGHFEEVRRAPGEDLLSRIVVAGVQDAERGGVGLDGTELASIASLLLAAGFETTVNLLGNGTVLLLQHPAALAGLRADPSGWPNAVEEILRFDSPVQHTYRYPIADTVLHGVPAPRGKIVVLMLAGANRDPAVFADPDVFDVARPNAREHVTFSAGAHYCLGAALARAEGAIGLRLLFERFPGLALAGPRTRRRTQNLRGFDTVPVRLWSAAGHHHRDRAPTAARLR